MVIGSEGGTEGRPNAQSGWLLENVQTGSWESLARLQATIVRPFPITAVKWGFRKVQAREQGDGHSPVTPFSTIIRNLCSVTESGPAVSLLRSCGCERSCSLNAQCR